MRDYNEALQAPLVLHRVFFVFGKGSLWDVQVPEVRPSPVAAESKIQDVSHQCSDRRPGAR